MAHSPVRTVCRFLGSSSYNQSFIYYSYDKSKKVYSIGNTDLMIKTTIINCETWVQTFDVDGKTYMSWACVMSWISSTAGKKPEGHKKSLVNKWEKHILSFPPKMEMLSAENKSGWEPVDMQLVEARQVGEDAKSKQDKTSNYISINKKMKSGKGGDRRPGN